jgi:ferrous iron transport protein A
MHNYKYNDYLSNLSPGEEAIICQLDAHSDVNARLHDLGLCNGTPVKVIKCAPLGDPMEIKIRGFHLSIRKSVAKRIRVQRRHRHRGRHFEEFQE